MKFSVDRDKLLITLQKVSGVVERKSSEPILSHVLLQITSHQLRIVGTDMDVEICSVMTLSEPAENGDITVPARKLLDICKALPEKSVIEVSLQKEKVILTSKNSRFTLATLPVESFPKIELKNNELEFSLDGSILKDMFDRTFFAVAQQDVRFYLNGLLMQVKDNQLIAVGTDGHRLSMFNTKIKEELPNYEIIIPRKGVSELLRLLDHEEEEVKIYITDKHFSVNSNNFIFISKKIEGQFPNYNGVIPKEPFKNIICDRDNLKNALSRVSILTNEKYKGVQLQLKLGALRLSSKNPEHEEAEEELAIEYTGENMELGFNVSYLLDILVHIPKGAVQLSFTDSVSSVLIKAHTETYDCLYVVMPMRI